MSKLKCYICGKEASYLVKKINPLDSKNLIEFFAILLGINKKKPVCRCCNHYILWDRKVYDLEGNLIGIVRFPERWIEEGC